MNVTASTSPRRKRVARLARERGGEDRPVGVDPDGLPALPRERVLESLRRDVGASAEDAARAARERAREGRGRERRRLQVRVAAGPAAERRRRALADHGDLRADVARRRESLAQHVDGRGARERDPVEPPGGELLQRRRERRGARGHQPDRRRDEDARSAALELPHQRRRLLGRARDEDRPPGEGSLHPCSSARIRSAPSARSRCARVDAATPGSVLSAAVRIDLRTVGRGDESHHPDPVALRGRERPERKVAAAAQELHEGPLGLERPPRREMVQDRDDRPRGPVVLAHLDGQAALPGCRHHLVDAKPASVRWIDAEPREPRRREHESVHLAFRQLPEPRVHVPADLGHAHPREPGEELGAAADARRPDHHPRLEPLVAPDQDVQRIGPLRHGGDHDPLLVLGGQVLRGVHGDVDLAGAERLDDPVDPEALHARR